jgi:tRNA(fMet)-specific endonuclease VapC
VKYLLDTNTCIAAMRSHPQVVGRMALVLPDDLAISTITSYELFTGIAKCANPVKEQVKVEKLLQLVGEVPFDTSAATEAARIRAALEMQGKTIGP